MGALTYQQAREEFKRYTPLIIDAGIQNLHGIQRFQEQVRTEGTSHFRAAELMAKKLRQGVDFAVAVEDVFAEWPCSHIELAKVFHTRDRQDHFGATTGFYGDIESWIEAKIWDESYQGMDARDEYQIPSETDNAFPASRYFKTVEMIPNGTQVLIETGCGSAKFLLKFLALNQGSPVKAVGIDPSTSGEQKSLEGIDYLQTLGKSGFERFRYIVEGIPLDREIDPSWRSDHAIYGNTFVFSHGVLEHFEPAPREMFLRNNALIAGQGSYVMVGVPNRRSPSESYRLRSYGIGLDNTTGLNMKPWVPFNLFRYEIQTTLEDLLSLMKKCGISDFDVIGYSPYKHFHFSEGFWCFDNIQTHKQGSKRDDHYRRVPGTEGLPQTVMVLEDHVRHYYDPFFSGELRETTNPQEMELFFGDLIEYGYVELQQHLAARLGINAQGVDYKHEVEDFFREKAGSPVRINHLYSTLFGCMIMAKGVVGKNKCHSE